MYNANVIKNPDLSHYFAKYNALTILFIVTHEKYSFGLGYQIWLTQVYIKYFSFVYNLNVPLGTAIYFPQ